MADICDAKDSENKMSSLFISGASVKTAYISDSDDSPAPLPSSPEVTNAGFENSSVLKIPARVVQYTRDQLLMIRGLVKASHSIQLSADAKKRVGELGITATKPVDKTPTAELITALTEKFQANMLLAPVIETAPAPISSNIDVASLSRDAEAMPATENDASDPTSELVANIRAKREHGAVGKNLIKSASLRRAAWEWQRDAADKKEQATTPKFQRSISESGGYNNDDAGIDVTSSQTASSQSPPKEWPYFQPGTSRRPGLKRRNTSPNKRHQLQQQLSQHALKASSVTAAAALNLQVTPEQACSDETLNKHIEMKQNRRAETRLEAPVATPFTADKPPMYSNPAAPPVRHVAYMHAPGVGHSDSMTVQFANDRIPKRLKSSHPSALKKLSNNSVTQVAASVRSPVLVDVDAAAVADVPRFAVIDTSVPSFKAVDAEQSQPPHAHVTQPPHAHVTQPGMSSSQQASRQGKGVSAFNHGQQHASRRGGKTEHLQRSRSLHAKKTNEDFDTPASQRQPGAVTSSAANSGLNSADDTVLSASNSAAPTSPKKTNSTNKSQTQFYDARLTSQLRNERPKSYYHLKQRTMEVRRSKSMKESRGDVDTSSDGGAVTGAAQQLQANTASVTQRPRTKSLGKSTQAPNGSKPDRHKRPLKQVTAAETVTNASNRSAKRQDDAVIHTRSKSPTKIVPFSTSPLSFMDAVITSPSPGGENANPWQNFKNIDPSFFANSTAHPVFIAQPLSVGDVNANSLQQQQRGEKEKRSRHRRRKAWQRQMTSQRQTAMANDDSNSDEQSTPVAKTTAVKAAEIRMRNKLIGHEHNTTAHAPQAPPTSDSTKLDADEQVAPRVPRNALRRQRQRERKRNEAKAARDSQGHD